jgi:predicted nuclease of restriction endonuclease-like (RecB) superfamily
MEQFLHELGAGFTFVAGQKRLQIDDDDFYLDLLFYNRKLRRLVAVQLNLEKCASAKTPTSRAVDQGYSPLQAYEYNLT